MKKLIVVTVLITAAGMTMRADDGRLRESAKGFWKKLTMPFRIMRLHSHPADERLLMPVQGARIGRVADTWHAPRPGGRRHEGQDIFAPRGTPVLSATRGIVVRIGDGGLGGKTVSVAGPGGRTYYYAHLDSYASDLAVGGMVNPGAILGYVGNTGNARGAPPHLHFGVYTRTGPVNPLPLLAAAQAAPASAAD
jgi:peptidoglycan LD-endopeptidase LytH